jgi:hypothetical protein
MPDVNLGISPGHETRLNKDILQGRRPRISRMSPPVPWHYRRWLRKLARIRYFSILEDL